LRDEAGKLWQHYTQILSHPNILRRSTEPRTASTPPFRV
jgi:hypothetical protein